MNLKNLWGMTKATAREWTSDDASEYSAALAYFAIFSIAPLLIIAVAVAGFVFGQASAQEKIMGQLTGMMGSQAAQQIGAMMESARQMKSGPIWVAIGIVTLLLGASRIFAELKKMLNRVWEVEPPLRGGFSGFIRQKLVAGLMVLLVGVLLIGLLVASAVISSLSKFVGTPLPGMALMWRVIDLAVTVGLVTVLFAMIYKYLPDTKIRWGDVWVGALVTAVLFAIGKYLIGLYLAHGSVASPYGAAGSLVVILVWLYYTGMIFFFGAEFTEVFSRQAGSRRPALAAGGAPVEPTPAEQPAREVLAWHARHPASWRRVLVLAAGGLLSLRRMAKQRGRRRARS